METNTTSPFKKEVQSNNPQAIRKYKKTLEININRFKIKERLERLIKTVNNKKLNNKYEIELNQIDADIATSMLTAEKSIQSQNHNHPWLPTLYRAIRKVQYGGQY